MRGWGIFALVCIVFFLIGQIRVGVDARYGEDGPLVKVRLGCFRIKVFPRPAKPPKEKKTKKKHVKASGPDIKSEAKRVQASAADSAAAAEQPEPGSVQPAQKQKPAAESKTAKKKKQTAQEPEKKAGKKMTPEQILALAREFVPLALEAVSALWGRLVMDDLELSVTVAGPDPADAAMLYGKINAAMAAFWYPINEACHVKNGRAHVDVDFNAQSITLYAHTALSIKIGQILQVASHFGVKALRKFLKVQKEQKAREQARKAV